MGKEGLLMILLFCLVFASNVVFAKAVAGVAIATRRQGKWQNVSL